MGCNRKQGYLQHKKYNMSIFEQILAFIAPHHCAGCGQEGYIWCMACAVAAPQFPGRCYRCGRRTVDFRTCPSCRSSSELYKVWACTVYDGAAKEVIHRLKFARARAAANDIARTLAARYTLPDDIVITHIPTVPARVRMRGYDQAALIARALAAYTGLPYASLLVRQGMDRQVGHGRRVRQQQMQDAFRPRKPQLLKRHVLLVDDVLTTGATCEAAARILRAAGVRRVSAMVFAAA